MIAKLPSKMGSYTLQPLDRDGLDWAQEKVTKYHYRHTPVDARCSVEGYAVTIYGIRVGCLLFGRPEATRCYPWYGSVEDVQIGRAEVTRWQVLNLARVWLDPVVQTGGKLCIPNFTPGYFDRQGAWRSTLASTVIRQAVERIGYEYLVRRPPCFLDEPYQIRWLLSYCDPAYHRGVIYKASGFELYRTNHRGLMTWRILLPGLTSDQDATVREIARCNALSQEYRARRAQLPLMETA